MALPTTGPISLLDIFKEKFFKDSDYPDPPHGMHPVSLTEMTVGTDFFPLRDLNEEPYVDGVNTQSSPRPDGSVPHAMSEFRGYNEDAITSLGSVYDMLKRQGQGLNSLTLSSNHINIISQKDILVPLYTDFPLDFQGPVLDGYLTWRQVDIPVDSFRGVYITPRVLFKQAAAGNFKNDVGVSGMWVFLDANKNPILGQNNEYIRWDMKPNYYYSASAWKSNVIYSTDAQPPTAASAWTPILFDDDIVLPPSDVLNGRWTIDGETTPSNGTGPNEEIIYYLGATYPNVWYSSQDDRNEYPALDSYNNRTKYLFYESSGISTAPTYNWMRFDRALQVPSNASYLTFCYDAYSEEQLTWNDDYLQVFLETSQTDPTVTTTFTQIAYKLSSKLYTGLDGTLNTDPIVYGFGGWRYVNYDLTANGFSAGERIRPYVLFNQSNVDLRNDVAVSAEWRFLDSSGNPIGENIWQSTRDNGYVDRTYEDYYRDIGQRSMQFVSGSTRENPQDVYIWQDIAYDDINGDRQDLKWNKEENSTPTSGTGPTDGVFFSNTTNRWEVDASGFPQFYFYFESSGSHSTPLREWFRWKNFRAIPSGAKYLTFCYSAESEDGEADYANDYLKVFLESDGGITPPSINFP